MYRGVSVPEGVKTFRIKSGQECYLSALRNDNGQFIALVYVFEVAKFVERNFKEIEKYL
jgi:hypothetical protein